MTACGEDHFQICFGIIFPSEHSKPVNKKIWHSSIRGHLLQVVYYDFFASNYLSNERPYLSFS